MSASISQLRADPQADHTLENLLHALTLNFELRDRYRVYEYEAQQDGQATTAQMFSSLRRVEGQQIADLLADLHRRLRELSAAGQDTA